MAIRTAPGRMAARGKNSNIAVVSTAKLTSRRWPASMLAKSRTAMDSGRTKNTETNSMGVTRMYRATGTPGGNSTDLR